MMISTLSTLGTMYIVGVALTTLITATYGPRNYSWYDLYQDYKRDSSDENAYNLMVRISKDIFFAILWPGFFGHRILRQFFSSHYTVHKLIVGSIRYSATIKQHSLDDKTSIQGGLSMVEPIGEGTTGRYDP